MRDQQNEELEQKLVTKGPGSILQTSRIEKGVSIEDIARQMNLNAKILKSIEDDEYKEIQSPIFIRGYLRTYARLVDVDEDQMIKLFAEVYQKDDPAIKSISNTATEISSNDIRVKWMTYSVIIGLVALLSVWWVNNYHSIDSSVNVDTQVQQDMEFKPIDVSDDLKALKDNGKDINSNIKKAESDLVIEEETVDNNADSLAIAVTEIDIDEKVEEIVIESSDENTSNTEDLEKSANLEETLVDTKENSAIPTEALSEEEMLVNTEAEPILKKLEGKKTFTKEVTATTGSDVIELNIISTSWGNIKDASKFKLVQDLLNTGTTYRLVGQAPFKVFLGNGYGVELKLNGKIFDFSKHIKSSNNTARFELRD